MSDHHDHHLPPPEPDHINAASISVWGLLSFITVIGTVVGLSDYFWLERENAAHAKLAAFQGQERGERPRKARRAARANRRKPSLMESSLRRPNGQPAH